MKTQAPVLAQRAPLSAARIVEAAIAFSDTHGLSALTMRSLAAELGVQPMSLYHHVDGKEAIVAGMIDALLSQTDLAAGAKDWREWVEGVFDALRSIAQTHPGAMEVLQTSPTSGATAREASRVGFESFLTAGFTPLQSVNAVNAVSLAALGLSSNERVAHGAPQAPDTAALAELQNSHPALAQVTLAQLDGLDVWEFTRSALIAGFESMLPR